MDFPKETDSRFLQDKRMNRREFLYCCGLGITVTTLFKAETMPKRLLGRTGVAVSLLGLGTSHFHRLNARECTVLVHAALDAGVNYVDTARVYGNGQTEILLGNTLRSRKRDGIILTSKTRSRSADEALHDLHTSLRSLRTDYLDIWMIHDFRTESDWRAMESPRGVLAAALRARDQGWIRWIGLTAHRNAPLVARALETFPCDIVMIPVTPVIPSESAWLDIIIPSARVSKPGIVGMKLFQDYLRAQSEPAYTAAAIQSALARPLSTVVMEWETPRELINSIGLASRAPSLETDSLALTA